jgi:hypothetical protein
MKKLSFKQRSVLSALPFFAIMMAAVCAGGAMSATTVQGTLTFTDSNNLPVVGGVTIYAQDSQYWGLYKHAGLEVTATVTDASGNAVYTGLTAGATYVAMISDNGHQYSASFVAVNATTPIQVSSTDWIRGNLLPIGVGVAAALVALFAFGWVKRDKIADAIKI